MTIDHKAPPIHRLSPAQAERRRSILAAAGVLGGEGGYDAVTISAVAKKAGVARATLYHYFGSKDQLLAEVTIAQTDEIIAAFRADPPRGNEPYERIANMLERIVDWALERPMLFRALSSSWTSSDRSANPAQRALANGMLEYLRMALGSEVPGDELSVARAMDHVFFAVMVQLSIDILTRDQAVADLAEAARLIVLGAGRLD